MTRVDKEATRFGSPFSNADLEVNRKMPKPLKVEFMDVNKDGLKDAVFTFPIKTRWLSQFQMSILNYISGRRSVRNSWQATISSKSKNKT